MYNSKRLGKTQVSLCMGLVNSILDVYLMKTAVVEKNEENLSVLT